jgi:hypothetical protein
VIVVARAEGVVVPGPEAVVALGAGRAGLRAVVATVRGAATGEDDEHAARASPGHPGGEHDTDRAMARTAASSQRCGEVLSGHEHAGPA